MALAGADGPHNEGRVGDRRSPVGDNGVNDRPSCEGICPTVRLTKCLFLPCIETPHRTWNTYESGGDRHGRNRDAEELGAGRFGIRARRRTLPRPATSVVPVSIWTVVRTAPILRSADEEHKLAARGTHSKGLCAYGGRSMQPRRALQLILGLGLFGTSFSGVLTYRELFAHTAAACPAPGAPGTVFGYPACVYGFFVYLCIVVISGLGLLSSHAADAPPSERAARG